ncbi:molybdopterin-dependent oxidoreductase [Candidatus Woesearchaeota archaeon]|nr:molybdopterin-dependent oxidoreductase [Candidatus Woesearchaeota archaeon]
MKNAKPYAVAALLGMLLFSGCAPKSNLRNTDGTQAIEVRNYQGEKLDSVNDFRENSIKGPQEVNISSYQLGIEGLVESPKNFSYEELLSCPSQQKVTTLHCVEGWATKILWEGVKLEDLLAETGIKPGANTVIFRAYDGYSTSLPLQYIKDNDIMLAYKMNNATLLPQRGFPLQLVAEDKWGYKWIKWVTSIELSDNSSFKGFWERQGYSNNGDLKGPMFDRR